MAIKKYRPTSPGLRTLTVIQSDEITKHEPEKSLLAPIKKNAGRNSRGKITVRHRGGGAKRKYRIIDFKRDKDLIPANVAGIEYDPNRSANIALLHYADGEKRYILAPKGLKAGDKIMSGKGSDIKIGNCLKLKDMPVGTEIHNIEMKAGKGGQLVRSAGTAAILTAKEDDYCQVKLPSGEIRKIHSECYSTIGIVGNKEHINVTIGKAGRSRWLNRRPKVRGVAMNPVDHPLGGGEGKSSGGRHPVSPTGQPTKGYKTRKRHKYSDNYIIKRRKG